MMVVKLNQELVSGWGRLANKAWCVLINHTAPAVRRRCRLLTGREASPVLVKVRPPDSRLCGDVAG
jgi:hypothetical protein